MSYESLKFKPSLLASFITNQRDLPSKQKLEEVRSLLNHHSADSFKMAIEFLRKFWTFFRSDPTTLNFESVFNKYSLVYGIDVRQIPAPVIS